MLKVLHADISNINTNTYNVHDVCPTRAEYLESITDERRKKQSYFVWRLLEFAVNRLNVTGVDFSVGADGKWFDRNGNVFFSLSHSDSIVAVGVSVKSDVGIDVERCTPRIFNVRRRLLDNVPENITEHEKIALLTTKWTEIESEFKCGGKSQSFKSVRLNGENGRHYVLTACTDEEVSFEKIFIEKL